MKQNYSPLPARKRSHQEGSILFVIMIMVILAGLGSGMALMYGTSSNQKVEQNLAIRARELAEAGYRYVAGEYAGADAADKLKTLQDLNGRVVLLNDNDGSFQVNVFAYAFFTNTDYTTGDTALTLDLPGDFPDDFDGAMGLPSSGTIKIGTQMYNFTNGVAVEQNGSTGDQFTLTLNSSGLLSEITTGTEVNLVVNTSISQTIDSDGLVTGNDDDRFIATEDDLIGLFPGSAGIFEVRYDNKSLGSYRYEQSYKGSVELSNISVYEDGSLPLTIPSGADIVIKSQIYLNVSGELGANSLTRTNDVDFMVPLTTGVFSPSDSAETLDLLGEENQESFNDEVAGKTQLNNWEVDDSEKDLTEEERKIITTQVVETKLDEETWVSSNYVTFQNFTEVMQDQGYTAELIDKSKLPSSVRNTNFNGVWGNASDNIYFVGDGGVIVHWDGTEFTKKSSGTNKNLNAIWGTPSIKTSANSDETDKIAAVGDEGTFLINEGNGWSKSTHSETYDINAVWGTSWGHFDGYGEAGTNPYNWDSPNTANRLQNYSWYRRNLGSNVNFRSLWAKEYTYGGYKYQNIMVGDYVGGSNDGKGIIFHEFFGPGLETEVALRGVWGSSFSSIYTVGDKGTIYHNTEGDSSRKKWYKGWEEVKDTEIPASVQNINFNGVYGNADNDFYVIGDAGTILYNKGAVAGKDFILVPNENNETLNSIWGSDRTGIYAVGENGTIIFLGYPKNSIGEMMLPLAKNEALSDKWTDKEKLLNYQVQLKSVWDENLEYAGAGINFRWHQSETHSDKYEGYGVSLLRYDSSENTYNDLIPNVIKPEYMASLEKNDKTLIVVWKQYVEGGAEKKNWLVYKDISDDTNAVINQKFKDLDSLVLKVQEKIINGVKTNEINIFYGNASGEYQTADNQYDNIVRYRYNPTFAPVGYTGSIKWPEENLDIWEKCDEALNCTSKDFLTMVKDVSVAQNPELADFDTNNKGYWVINPLANDVELLSDRQTIRTGTHTTPSGDTFGTQAERSEIGIHVFGNIGATGTNERIHFTDFAVTLGVDRSGSNQDSQFGTIKGVSASIDSSH